MESVGGQPMTLPGPVPPTLAAILSSLTEEQAQKVEQALQDDTPAELIADAVGLLGYSVSPTTIRTYRRRTKRLERVGAL